MTTVVATPTIATNATIIAAHPRWLVRGAGSVVPDPTAPEPLSAPTAVLVGPIIWPGAGACSTVGVFVVLISMCVSLRRGLAPGPCGTPPADRQEPVADGQQTPGRRA